MKVRGLAIVLAMLLAVGATAAVYLYVQGVREDARAPAEMVKVVVSKQDIAAGTQLDNLISSGAFTTLSIPGEALVEGSVTELSQLKGQTTRFPILQGEQITAARFQESEFQVAGGVLGIPSGFKAVTLSLGLPQAVGGVVQAGDHVTLYATFDDIKLVTGLDAVLAGKGATEKQHSIGTFTVTVVPDVQVLKASSPGSSDVVDPDRNLLLTLALTPEDSQHVVFAQEHGRIWLALLPPNERGTPEDPTTGIELVVPSAAPQFK